MHLVLQCPNCGGNVTPEVGVATPTTVQHRACAERFGVGTHGSAREPRGPRRADRVQGGTYYGVTMLKSGSGASRRLSMAAGREPSPSI